MNNPLEKVPLLRLEGISRQYASFSLKEIDFSIHEGDYFILLGVSGAGKSMILETIAGLVTPDSGTIRKNGLDITNESIQNRKIGIVFQDHAVFPHMSVYENILYPIKKKIHNKSEKDQLVKEIAENLGIRGLLNRKPSTLSGGELQRVALARTLVQKPDLLLLDEPLASLDIKLKTDLRSTLRRLNKQGQTIIHVTHDYEEAISLGNRIAVIHDGRILQYGTPEEVFHHPRSEFVAHFTGAKNFFNARFSSGSREASVTGKLIIQTSSDTLQEEGFILIRSEDIFLSETHVETSAVNQFQGTILEMVPTPGGFEIKLDIGITLFAAITRESAQRMGLHESMTCFACFKASAVRIID
ncbi:MAG: ATP-binding cassette domain-containing protein [Bacteroidales bacterium]|nr:ATP-binding cassette domain-containing protein [Bacteroidales bacterium]